MRPSVLSPRDPQGRGARRGPGRAAQAARLVGRHVAGRPRRVRRPGHRRRDPGARGRPRRQARGDGRRLRGPARRKPLDPARRREGWREGGRAARSPLRRVRRVREAHRLGGRRGPALHAPAVPPAAPAIGHRRRQARVRREAGRRRCPGRPLRPGGVQDGRRRRGSRSSRACACATTSDSARPSSGSTTAAWARSTPCSPTITAADDGPSPGSPA